MRIQIVRSGMAAVSVGMADGRRQIMCFLVPGDVICPFGIAGADCTAEALTETETCEFLVPADEDAMADPDVSALLFKLSHDLLARSLNHIVQLGRFDGMERVCAFLTDIAERIGRRRNGSMHLTLPMSRDDIADFLGLNSETVSRILTRIKRDGIARFRSRTECEIQDYERLKARVPLRPHVMQDQTSRLGEEVIR